MAMKKIFKGSGVDSPLFNHIARAQKLTALSSYEEQGEKLQELYEREGRDYFVASYIGEHIAHHARALAS